MSSLRRPADISDTARESSESPPRRIFYRRWIAACTVGELAGIGAATVAGVTLVGALGEPQSLQARLLVLAVFAAVGAVEGGALAALQWRVMRDRLPRLRVGEWVLVTVGVAVIGWIVGMTPSLFLSEPASATSGEPGLAAVLSMAAAAGGGAGFCFGAAQWFILRRHAERASRWIWVHIPAWALAMAAIFLGASLPTAQWVWWQVTLSGVAGGVLGGLVLGLVTGPVACGLTPWVAEAHWSLRGAVCAVTGANSGLGQEIALGLARLGASVVLLCRRASEGEPVRRRVLMAVPDADVSVVTCDLSDLASVRRAADSLLTDRTRLDVLVHNAGATFPRRTVTADGVEATQPNLRVGYRTRVSAGGPVNTVRVLVNGRPLSDSKGQAVRITGDNVTNGTIDVPLPPADSDISLIAEGAAHVTTTAKFDGYPIKIAMDDVNVIGAGGGSIAWVDRGGALCVGPQSATAVLTQAATNT